VQHQQVQLRPLPHLNPQVLRNIAIRHYRKRLPRVNAQKVALYIFGNIFPNHAQYSMLSGHRSEVNSKN
jgi:hypothetical protein